MRKNIVKRMAGIVGIMIVLFVIYHFLFGRLFPWSPMQLGFKPVKVILPETHSQYTRFSGVRALACGLQSGTVVFLSPDIPKEKRNRVDLLKHELSHVLLFRHIGMLKSFKLPEWFQEGIAIYYGNPRDNFVGEAFTKAAVDDGYFFNILNAKQEIQKIPFQHRYRFLHSEYRCFMEYLTRFCDIPTFVLPVV